MEQRIFYFLLIIQGATEKVLQFTMPLKVVYSKKMVSFNKNVFLNIAEMIRVEKILKWHYFYTKHLFCLPTFQELPPMWFFRKY